MRLETVVDGLGYVESPRWHAGRLWLSDFDRRQVLTVSADGRATTAARIPGVPSGLAFIGDDLLVASMHTGTVLRVGPGGANTKWADLSHAAVGLLNDMTLDARGNLFVGCFGYDLSRRERPRPGPLLRVDASRTVSVACSDVTFANGMALLNGGRTLLVAETPRRILTSFTIADDGELRDRAVFAALGDRQADGICLDANGGVWIASPFTEEFVRLDSSARVTHVVPTPGRWAVACALGGDDGTTFFGLTAETDLTRFSQGRSRGRVECGTAPYPAKSEECDGVLLD